MLTHAGFLLSSFLTGTRGRARPSSPGRGIRASARTDTDAAATLEERTGGSGHPYRQWTQCEIKTMPWAFSDSDYSNQ